MRGWHALPFLLLLSVSLLGQSSPEQQIAAQQRSSEAQKAPPAVPAQPPVQQKQGQSNNASCVPPWSDPFWSNWALVVVGMITAWIAIGTLSDLKEQTGAAKIAANAAQKSAEVAEAALKLAERADILLSRASFDRGPVLNPKDCRVVLEYKNFGRTKAKDVKFTLNLVIDGVPPTDNRDIPPITMGAGETKQVASQRFIEFMSGQTAQGIFSATTILRFESEAIYKDIFSDQPHRSYYEGTLDIGTNSFRIDKQESD
jgi:hypothetical protein